MLSRLTYVLVAAALGACSPTQIAPTTPSDATDATTGSGTDGMTFDALSADEACASVSKARCEKLDTCSPADLQHRFGDVSTCEAREILACTNGENAPDTASTPEAALACGIALTASTCGEFLGNGAPPAACSPPNGPGNGTCAFDGQCSTSFCAVGANALCGLCQAEPTVGTSCAASTCGDLLICASATHTCVTPGTANSQCNQSAPCGGGFNCVGATQQNPGRCQPVVATLGGTCDDNHHQHAGCSGDAGLTCNTQSNKCVVQPFAVAGQPCGIINNVGTDCSAGAHCVIPNNQTKGTCVAPAADGGACNTVSGPDCFFPARCIPATPTGTSGTCQLPGSKSC